MGEKFPAVLLKASPHIEEWYGTVRRVAGWSFPWTFVMQYTAQLVECLKVTSSIDGFPLWQKFDKYASCSIPEDSSQHLTGCRHCLGLLFLGWWCVMPFHALLLCLDHSDGTSIYQPSTCCKESLPLTAYCSSNCEETFCTEVCALPLASAHMLSGIKLAAISRTTWCPNPISAAISLSQVDFLWWAHQIFFVLFLSVETVCRIALWDLLAIFVFPSWRCLTIGWYC